ncbi:MAG: serine hydrolase [Candidatus Omnitrophota bacterium]
MEKTKYNTRTAGYALCIMFFVLFVLAGCAREVPPDVIISVNAQAAMIAEAKSGETLFEKNAAMRFPPASTAKVMTAIIAIENMSLTEEIIPNKEVLYVEPTRAKLVPGVKYKLEDLIAALLVKSANDAAIAIAEAVAGSEENFVILMNAKAKKLGMEDTYFATASGLPTGKKDNQYTTAKDLIKMMRYAMRHRIIPYTMSLEEAHIYGSDKKRIYLKTHNKTLLHDGMETWGKTGYTKEAKRTFVGTDPSPNPRIVFSLLKSSDLWNDIVALKDGGLKIYDERHATFIGDIMKWIREQKQRGRMSLGYQNSP